MQVRVECAVQVRVQCAVHVRVQCAVHVRVQCAVHVRVECAVQVKVQCAVQVSVQCAFSEAMYNERKVIQHFHKMDKCASNLLTYIGKHFEFELESFQRTRHMND